MNLFFSKKNQVITYSTIENYVWEGSFVSLESIKAALLEGFRKILNKEYIFKQLWILDTYLKILNYIFYKNI